jgi:hypothetical protein
MDRFLVKYSMEIKELNAGTGNIDIERYKGCPRAATALFLF